MKCVDYVKDDVKVQVIGCWCDDPIVHIVGHFYGTAVMNIITADWAYCLFPLRTVIWYEMQQVKGRPFTCSEKRAVAKYERRGWKCVSYERRVEDGEFRGRRFVGDRYTWSIPLFPRERLSKDDELSVPQGDVFFEIGRHEVAVSKPSFYES